MNARVCPTCGQILPEQARRDPPLPPLEHPAIVTIHDLPPEERAKAKVRKTRDMGYFLERRP
jgi:hypothetical protein